jgi:hypothetical protein
MKTTEILLSKSFDRLILVQKANGIIMNLDFMQGTDESTRKMLLESQDTGNFRILDIYNNILDNEDYMDTTFENELQRCNHAIELYCSAFIYGRNFTEESITTLKEEQQKDVYSLIENFRKANIDNRKFMCFWNEQFFTMEKDTTSIEEFDFFDEEIGYDNEDITEVDKLEIGKSVTLSIGHIVTRVK